ncbi:MAG: hypothetical protein HRT81_06470 [Henriciella sp.]|nr:hypothetical protein [Henriciella sp.]
MPESVAAAPAAVPQQKRNRTQGRVVECNGTEAKISAFAQTGDATGENWAVGQLISIQTGDNRVVGLLYRVENDIAAQQ